MGFAFIQMMSERRYQPSARSAKASSHGTPIMSSRNWPLGSALSVFLIAGTMILVYLYARVSRADVMEGGL